MEIVVCVKPVPEAETRLRPDAAGVAPDAEGVKFVLAGYDESAVEQALLLKEAIPGSRVHAVACGPAPRTEEVLRSALALGCDAATWVEAPASVADEPQGAARALGAALATIPHELVLCGKQAGDNEAGVVAAALGEYLGIVDLGFVLDVRWNAAEGQFTLRRATEAGQETWTVAPPCVLGLQQAWNDPRTAKLPAILKSRKATIAKFAPPTLPEGPRSVARTFALPPPRSGARMIEYKTPEDAASQLVRLLRDEAKVLP